MNQNAFNDPENLETPVLRFVDFTKFVSMLHDGALYFSRLDKLGDEFEGSFPVRNRKLSVADFPSAVDGSNLQIVDAILKGSKTSRQYAKKFRLWTFANCWYISEHETPAMWSLYTRTEESVCIKTSYAKLKKLLPSRVFLGTVTYLDYDSDLMPHGNYGWPFMCKRNVFEREREARAIYLNHSGGGSIPTGPIQSSFMIVNPKKVPPPAFEGILCPIDLAALVECVYTSPKSPQWFATLVAGVIRKYGYSFPVCRSKLDSSPGW